MFNKLSIVVMVAMLAAGCGVKAQTYVMNKERADQAPSGNAGCLSGKCADAPAPLKNTRKVYVLEVTKPLPELEIQRIESEMPSTPHVQTSDNVVSEESAPAPVEHKRQPVVIPSFDHASSAPAAHSQATGPKEAQSYTVSKDDTLQKISKKFYGTYSKWTKIYDANKEVIKNPNFVKPGTVLTIPAVE